MARHYTDELRLYSGYDEYAGIFKPLSTSSSIFHSRWDLPPRSQGISTLRSWRKCSKLHQDRECAKQKFDYHSFKRKTKYEPPSPGGDIDGIEDLQDKENEPQHPTHHVCTPTRNFAFRERAAKLDTRAIARLDLEKIVATTDIDTIQKYLENLTFADVTLEDVQQYSDAHVLKLFQIAQLTLEYLMHVQDTLVDHSEGLEIHCEQMMTECQQLKMENTKHEIELASLKREIQQKQRSMATLELMLLNASASKRIDSCAAGQEARNLTDELLAKGTDLNTESGSLSTPVSCVLCGKRFISTEYLLRHQQQRHHETKKPKEKKKTISSSSFRSESDSDVNKKNKKQAISSTNDILGLVEEKIQLAKQLTVLQEQVRHDQEIREKQQEQIEKQQTEMHRRMEQCMEKLHTSLVEIEKKQQVTKQDLRQYTQETVARFQVQATTTDLMRLKTSRAGRLEDDDGEVAAKVKNADANWAAKVDKLMDSFLRAQAQKQQEVEALEQKSSKLWTKYHKLKKKQYRPEPEMVLANLTTLNAEEFGLDRGEVIETERLQHGKRSLALEDKICQTHEEKAPKEAPTSRVLSDKVHEQSDSKVFPRMEEIVVAELLPMEEEGSELLDVDESKFQYAAHTIGKVALGFLARRVFAKSSKFWNITLKISSLEAALTVLELEYARQRYKNQLQIQVKDDMTANELRVVIAKMLCGKDDLESDFATCNSEDKINATMTYHRVRVHHQQTGAQLSGDVLIYELRNVIRVEILPYHAIQVGKSIESSGRDDESKIQIYDNKNILAQLVRLQAFARSFLAKKTVALTKIDQIVDAHLAKRKSTVNVAFSELKTLEPSWMCYDRVLGPEYEKWKRWLTQTLSTKLNRDDKSDEAFRLLPSAEYKRHRDDERAKNIPRDLQHRVQQIRDRITPMAKIEFCQREYNLNQGVKSLPASVHRAVQIEIVRKRLKWLIVESAADKAESTQDLCNERLPWSPNRQSGSKSGDSFDSNEIHELANAYEASNSSVDAQPLPRDQEFVSCERHDGRQREKGEKKPATSTSRKGFNDQIKKIRGRSGTVSANRENDSNAVISPFSKSRLISRQVKGIKVGNTK